jgi:hypothetical protein
LFSGGRPQPAARVVGATEPGVGELGVMALEQQHQSLTT